MKNITQAIKGAASDVGHAIGNVGKTAELLKATHPQLAESEAIKTEVRQRLDSIPQDKRTGSSYDNLIALHDTIESVHNLIYQRPENITDVNLAINDCNTWIGEQRATKANFDLAFNEYMPPAEVPSPRLSM